ncbi:MAG: ATP-dependent sacrificial sulfur transferase LarE [Candidatus Magnetominusculus sp. LBB02]|nr:ATP-dependent sacrificial sulfur transferase LarE [Candidatus Magnetominusculus sp. LBB02]
MLQEKYEALLADLRGLGGVVLAYSGGVDSSLLLMAVKDSGVEALAVTGVSPSTPRSDLSTAVDIAGSIAVTHEIIHTDELEDERYFNNSPDRCFYCKSELFNKLKAIADARNLPHVIDGSNADDLKDYRPGLRAKTMHGVKSPLAEAGLTKAEIRELSRQKGLRTWDRPSSPCLSSRMPYGELITAHALHMVEQAETALCELGFVAMRVRKHGDMARIELPEGDIEKAVKPEIKQLIVEKLKCIGFLYVAIDMEGYRSGSLNRVLNAVRQDA